LSRRLSLHRSDAKRGKRFYVGRAIHAYGWNAFTAEILYEAVDAREAAAVERALIASYGTMHPNGYNLSTGGFVPVMSPEARRKISIATKGRRYSAEQRAALSIALTGRRMPPVSSATREKLRRAKLGTTHSPESCAKISTSKRGIPATHPKMLAGLARGHELNRRKIAEMYPGLTTEEIKRLRAQRNRERAKHRSAARAIAAGRMPGLRGNPNRTKSRERFQALNSLGCTNVVPASP
jgi:hypothetical protein